MCRCVIVLPNACLDTQCYELQRAGVSIPLPPKVYQVLAYLLAQRDRVVPREELLAHVWPGVYVSEATLNSYIMAIRQALGDDGQNQRLVRTVRGRGYRFVARVEVQAQVPSADAPPREPPHAVAVPAPTPPPAPAVPAAVATSSWLAVPSADGEYKPVSVLCRRLSPDQVAWYTGQCLAYGQTTPYLPVRDLVQQLCALAEGDGTEARTAAVRQRLARLGQAAEDDLALLLQRLDLPVDPALLARLSPETQQARTFALLWHLILHEAQPRPLVLAVEDVHWIDLTSKAWLAFLVERLAGAAVLLLVTQRAGYRPPWGTHAAVTQLALPPLRTEDSQAVVKAVPGTAHLPTAQCQQIVAHGAGNPFFVAELAWHAVEHGLSATPVPETVHAVLAARIDWLPAAEKSLLQTAAVIGHEVSWPLLQAIAVLPEDALQRCLAYLQATEFLHEVRLFPERAFTFKHALTQEVAYGSLLQERRRALHTRIVEALAALADDRESEQVERLAHHALQGEVWGKAVVYCRQAGEKAMARSTLREALAYFEQVLTAIQHLPERRETMEQTIDLRLAIRSALIALRNYAALSDHLRAAEALATTLDDPRRLGWVSTYMVNYYTHMGDYERALIYGQRALAAASGDFALEMMGTFFVGLCYLYLGRYRQAVSCHRHNTEALVGTWLDERFGEAGPLSVSARAFLAWGLAELGDFAEGSARGAEAVDQPFTLSHAYLGIGLLHARHGDLSQAIAVLERGLAVCQTGDMPLLLPHITAGLGYAYALVGRLAEALPLLEQAVAWVTSGHRMGTAYPLWITHLGEAYFLAGRLEDAHQLARRALAHTRGCKQQGYEAYALRLCGEVARQRAPLEVEPAEAAYQQAITLAETLEMRPLLAHCHLGLGTVYTQAGQRKQARAPLSTAVALYRAMGMTFWLPQAEATLAQVGGARG
jgi:DNA-binding winged helix-turn-helix (wHTH) protein/tetratricopeptide (TPR) repeat protein